jgi:hypothetical protein
VVVLDEDVGDAELCQAILTIGLLEEATGIAVDDWLEQDRA